MAEISVFHIKQVLEAQDRQGNWYRSRVIDKDAGGVLIHYMGWKQKFDEYIPIGSGRLRPCEEEESIDSTKDEQPLKAGDFVLAKWSNKEYGAKITNLDAEKETVELVFFDGFVQWKKMKGLKRMTAAQLEKLGDLSTFGQEIILKPEKNTLIHEAPKSERRRSCMRLGRPNPRSSVSSASTPEPSVDVSHSQVHTSEIGVEPLLNTDTKAEESLCLHIDSSTMSDSQAIPSTSGPETPPEEPLPAPISTKKKRRSTEFKLLSEQIKTNDEVGTSIEDYSSEFPIQASSPVQSQPPPNISEPHEDETGVASTERKRAVSPKFSFLSPQTIAIASSDEIMSVKRLSISTEHDQVPQPTRVSKRKRISTTKYSPTGFEKWELFPHARKSTEADAKMAKRDLLKPKLKSSPKEQSKMSSKSAEPESSMDEERDEKPSNVSSPTKKSNDDEDYKLSELLSLPPQSTKAVSSKASKVVFQPAEPMDERGYEQLDTTCKPSEEQESKPVKSRKRKLSEMLPTRQSSTRNKDRLTALLSLVKGERRANRRSEGSSKPHPAAAKGRPVVRQPKVLARTKGLPIGRPRKYPVVAKPKCCPVSRPRTLQPAERPKGAPVERAPTLHRRPRGRPRKLPVVANLEGHPVGWAPTLNPAERPEGPPVGRAPTLHLESPERLPVGRPPSLHPSERPKGPPVGRPPTLQPERPKGPLIGRPPTLHSIKRPKRLAARKPKSRAVKSVLPQTFQTAVRRSRRQKAPRIVTPELGDEKIEKKKEDVVSEIVVETDTQEQACTVESSSTVDQTPVGIDSQKATSEARSAIVAEKIISEVVSDSAVKCSPQTKDRRRRSSGQHLSPSQPNLSPSSDKIADRVLSRHRQSCTPPAMAESASKRIEFAIEVEEELDELPTEDDYGTSLGKEVQQRLETPDEPKSPVVSLAVTEAEAHGTPGDAQCANVASTIDDTYITPTIPLESLKKLNEQLDKPMDTSTVACAQSSHSQSIDYTVEAGDEVEKSPDPHAVVKTVSEQSPAFPMKSPHGSFDHVVISPNSAMKSMETVDQSTHFQSSPMKAPSEAGDQLESSSVDMSSAGSDQVQALPVPCYVDLSKSVIDQNILNKSAKILDETISLSDDNSELQEDVIASSSDPLSHKVVEVGAIEQMSKPAELQSPMLVDQVLSQIADEQSHKRNGDHTLAADSIDFVPLPLAPIEATTSLASSMQTDGMGSTATQETVCMKSASDEKVVLDKLSSKSKMGPQAVDNEKASINVPQSAVMPLTETSTLQSSQVAGPYVIKSFSSIWEMDRPWLCYDNMTNTMYCQACRDKQKPTTWATGVECRSIRIGQHENSRAHVEALSGWIAPAKAPGPIMTKHQQQAEIVRTQLIEERKDWLIRDGNLVRCGPCSCFAANEIERSYGFVRGLAIGRVNDVKKHEKTQGHLRKLCRYYREILKTDPPSWLLETEKVLKTELPLALKTHGFICDVQGCGKIFRKQDMLQAHQRHAHFKYKEDFQALKPLKINPETKKKKARPRRSSEVSVASTSYATFVNRGEEESEGEITDSDSELSDEDEDEQMMTDESDSDSSERSPNSELTNDDMVRCQCGKNEESGFMIQCDRCSTWQHGDCFNIANLESVPDPYWCYVCKDPPRIRSSQKYADEMRTNYFNRGYLDVIPHYDIDSRTMAHNSKIPAPIESRMPIMLQTAQNTQKAVDIVDRLKAVRLRMYLANHPESDGFKLLAKDNDDKSVKIAQQTLRQEISEMQDEIESRLDEVDANVRILETEWRKFGKIGTSPSTIEMKQEAQTLIRDLQKVQKLADLVRS